jgi:predicted small integral membrane protein
MSNSEPSAIVLQGIACMRGIIHVSIQMEKTFPQEKKRGTSRLSSHFSQRYNSRVRQPMRHIAALRVSKAVLVFAIALFYTILVLNNITDYGSNYEFVRHVLMMDSTFPGNHLMWRAVNPPLVHTVFYTGIIAWESVTMLLCWWAGVRLLKSYRADTAQFVAALNVAMIALTTSLLMWLVAFLDVGGEWFLMWQSKMWNGQEEAFRMFTIVGVVFLVVVQREPTPD